jgi:uncharacterized repeat protein (TIGR01451 family)
MTASPLVRLLPFLALVSAGAAEAGCPSNNQYSYSFASATAATLSYASSYSYTATNLAGQTQTFTVGFVANGLLSSQVAGIQMPNISNMITDGVATQNLAVGGIFTARTADVSTATRVVVTTFTFATPIRDFTVQVNDIDYALNQYRDWLQINGISAFTSYDPAYTTPFGNNNTVPGPHSATSSSQLIGATATPLSLTVRQSAGTSVSGNNANTGTITATFAQPVTSVEVRYGNYPLQTGEVQTGQQAIGIQQISFCPMPVVSMIKSSTPYSTAATDPNRFNIPGADVIYALTVSNTNTSPVDAGAIVLTDPLPANVTFYNGDIDDAGALTTNYDFVPGTSGLTFAPANLTYSDTGGTTYAYSPAAGYDTAVNAIRLNPQGPMAANSSFTLRFRARIK